MTMVVCSDDWDWGLEQGVVPLALPLPWLDHVHAIALVRVRPSVTRTGRENARHECVRLPHRDTGTTAHQE